MAAVIYDFSLALAARHLGEPRLAYAWTPAPTELNSAGGFKRGDKVLLPDTLAGKLTGSIDRIYVYPRTGQRRAHVLTCGARVSIDIDALRPAPSYI